jgi:cytoskeletal protein CcmA (bactofilin family)
MIRRIAVFLSFLLLAGGATAEDAWAEGTVRVGGHVEVTEPTAGALYAAGGDVQVEAPVNGPLRAAGGDVEVGRGAQIAGSASLAGGNVVVKGPIQGNLHVGAGDVTLDGPVAGDAYVGAGTLTLGPNARIEGKLKFRGGELNRDPGAQVAGGLVQSHGHSHRHAWTSGERLTRGWMWSLGLVVLAALLAGALPGPSQRLAQELRERPGMTALLGFLALTAIPVAAVMLAITIIGIPIALLAVVLYAALLMIGYVWLAVVLGGLLLDRFSAETAAVSAWRIGSAALAMIILAIVVRVPLVGGFVMLAALVVGVGMIVGAVTRKVRPPPAAAVTA